jgi:hypothetical protein
MPENMLYYGDNLDVLRRHIDKESVDRNRNDIFVVILLPQEAERGP